MTLKLAPVAKGRPRATLRGRKIVLVTPADTRKFERQAAQLARHAFKGAPLDVPLHLSVRFVLKAPGRPKWNVPAVRPDLDNYVKCLKDALNGVVWADDALICRLQASKLYDLTGAGPRIELMIEELPE